MADKFINKKNQIVGHIFAHWTCVCKLVGLMKGLNKSQLSFCIYLRKIKELQIIVS